MKINNSNIFWILIIFLCIIYYYPSSLFKLPQSLHTWRQTDCLSLTYNYYDKGMDFFKPATYNITSNNTRSSFVAPSEIPIGYYVNALLYKLFGPYELIPRLLNTIVFILGIYYFFRLLMLVQNNAWIAFFITFLLFSSPVLIYYGNNYLTDSSAFAFSIIGFYWFSRYWKLNESKSLYYSLCFFFLAGAFKISGLILFTALLLVVLTGKLNARFRNVIQLNITKNWIVFSFLIYFVIFAWAYYADTYNKLHGSGYFSTQTYPIWKMTNEKIFKVCNQIANYWIFQYFHFTAIGIWFLMLLYNFISYSKQHAIFYFINVVTFIGCFAYILLWFDTFFDHDYYTIPLFILCITNGVLFAFNLNIGKLNYLIKNKFVVFAAGAILILNIYHGHKEIKKRYFSSINNNEYYNSIANLKPTLAELGILSNDTIICIPDPTHLSLYLLKMYGTTDCLNENKDSASLRKNILNGANYLLADQRELYQRPYLLAYADSMIGQLGYFGIYAIKKYQDLAIQAIPPKFSILDSIYCSFELLTENGQYFKSDNSPQLFENTKMGNVEQYRSKPSSIKLDSVDRFGFTTRLENINFGDEIEVSLYYKGDAKDLKIVASFTDPSDFYVSKEILKVSNDWELFSLKLNVNAKPKDGKLSVYSWSPNGNKYYIDDVVICRLNYK